MTRPLPDICDDCGKPGRAGRSPRCRDCRKAHRTRAQTQAQALRRARRAPRRAATGNVDPVAGLPAEDPRIAQVRAILSRMATEANMARGLGRAGIPRDQYEAQIEALYRALA